MKSIEEFLFDLCNLDIKLWVNDDRLRCNAPQGVLTPTLKTEIAERKAEILTFLNKSENSSDLLIRPVSRDRELPLSFAQQRLWLIDRLEPDNSFYNMPGAVRLHGHLDLSALERTLQEIIRRHEALRTNFISQDGQPRQIIHQSGTWHMTTIDLQNLPASEREKKIQHLATVEAKKAFALDNDPLMRATLLLASEAEHVLLLTMHHIVSDGWSMGVFVQEVAALYSAFVQGETSPLPELEIQYVDFAVWQRQWLQGETLERQLNYWQKQLADAPVLLELPTDRPRPPVQTFNGASHAMVIPARLAAELDHLTQREGVTLFMTLLATFEVLLYRYTGQTDILVGSPIANRNRAEIENLIGFFINTLVLRSDLSENPTVRELLQQVREVALGAYAHQDLPFEMLIEQLQPERNLSHSPLFQVMFVLQNTPATEITLSDLQLLSMPVGDSTAKFDITLSLEETEDGLSGIWEYNTDLFSASTIERMANHFEMLLTGIIANPDRPISILPMLTATEQQQLHWDGNDTQNDDPQDLCIHQLFEQQVAETPEAVAVVYEDEQLTYRELNHRANQLAHHLMNLGATTETLVGLYVERSLEMIVGILGILKAEGAYIPLDPTHPPERLAAILEDAQVSILLTQQQLVENLPEYVGKRVCLDADWEVIAAHKDDNPVYKGIPDNLAYVIYTSGSTGKPKGVLVQHVNVIRLFTTTEQWFHFNQNDVWTLFHSVAFDFSVWEIWGALLHGGRLIVVPYIVSRSPEEFYHLLSRSQVTVLNQTPGAFSQLIQVEELNKALPELSLRLVIFGGEALKLPTLQPWFERHGDRVPQLVNMYGITETTVHVTYHPLTIADLDRTGSIIGRPLPDLQVYLLDRHLQPVPIGIPGEMYISGAGVARGYLQRSDLTAERFITNPFSTKSARLYKSGDLARYLPNGELEYLGRIDQQVKIRGFRIELGEVEAAISQHPQVSQVTVIDVPEERLRQREDIPGNRQLVAYVVTPSGKEVSSTEIRTYLKDKLPNYTIPAVVVCLDRLPLTPNGKVDRVALPAPDMSALSLSEKFVLPHTKTEQVLANIWAEILNIEKIGINDNFFDLGGHSLLATQIISRIHEALEVKLPLQDLFEQTTIASLAERIDDVSMTLKVFQEQSITSENEEEGTI